jgi:hypothetical protein
VSVFGYTFGRVPDGLLFSGASDRAKVLYAVLTRWADLRPGEHPTRNDLAEALGCSVDSMDRAKDELSEHGYLDVRPRYIDGTKVRDANDWHLLPGPVTEGDPLPGGSRKGAATITSLNGKAAGNGGRRAAAGGSRKGAATLDRTVEPKKEPAPSPNGETAKNEEAPTARDLLAEHIDALGHVLVTAGRLGATIKRLLDTQRVSADIIREALALMRRRGLTSPSVLPALVDEVQDRRARNGRRSAPVPPQELSALKADTPPVDRVPFGARYSPEQAAAILGGAG